MRAIALVFLVSTAAASASAQTTSIQASVEGQVSGVSLSETQGPAASGALLADLTWGPGQGFNSPNPAHAYAAQDDAGKSAVEVDAYPTLANQDYQVAESRWSRTVTNGDNRTLEYIYRFTIAPPLLALRKAGGYTGPGGTAAYFVSVKLNGQTIFASSATLTGSPTSADLRETGTDFGGVPFSNPPLGIYGFQFSTFQGLLSLGFHPAGSSFTVETVLRATSEAPDVGAGARATIGDPLDMGGNPGISSTIETTDAVGVEQVGWSAIKDLYR